MTTNPPGAARRLFFRRPSRKRSSQRGAVLVEAVFSLIFLLTMLFGIMVFSQMLFAYNSICHASREAVRYAIVHGFGSVTPATPADILQAVKNKTPGLDPNALTVTPTWCVTFNTACSTTPDITNSSAGNIVKIQVQYDFVALITIVPIPPVTLTSTSQMVISQ